MGAIVMDWSTGAKQVTVVEPVVVPVAVAPVAEIVADPLDVALALQLTRPAETAATLGALEAQVAAGVRSFVEPSVYVPVAFSCVVPPAATCGDAGVTLMDASAMTFTVACVKLVMLLPAAAEHMSCAEYVPSVVSVPVEMEPDPATLAGVTNVPSLAEIEH